MTDSVMPAPPVDLESLARTLNALFLGFQVIGFDWKYIYVNPAAAGHGRTTPEALIGRSIFESYPDIASQEPLMSHLRRAMEERTNHVFENQFTFPDGTMRWFHIRVEPVPEGICIYSVDIDERKTAEVALRDKLARLEGTRPTLLRRVWQSLANWGARRHGRGSAFKGRL